MKISSLPSSVSILVWAWIAATSVDALVTPPELTSRAPLSGQSMTVVRRSPPRLGADEVEAWARNKVTALTLKYGGGTPAARKRAVGMNL